MFSSGLENNPRSLVKTPQMQHTWSPNEVTFSTLVSTEPYIFKQNEILNYLERMDKNDSGRLIFQNAFIDSYWTSIRHVHRL